MAIQGKNSDLYRRLRLYGFGFLIGMLVVSVVYKGKGCQLPGSNKMEELRWQKLDSEHANCQMQCRHITEAEIKEILGDHAIQGNGKVNYDNSNVHEKPYPTYAVEGITRSGRNLQIVIVDVDTISRIMKVVDLNMKKDSCDCK